MIARVHGQKGRTPFYIDKVTLNICTFQASQLLITDLIHIKVYLEVGIQQMEFDSKLVRPTSKLVSARAKILT